MDEKKTPIIHRLTLGDPNGPHLELSADGFHLWGNALTLRASLHLDRGMPEFTLYDGNSHARLTLKVYVEGEAELKLLDGNETQRLSCGVGIHGNPHLTMADRKGTRSFAIDARQECAPALHFYGTEEHDYLAVSAEEENTSLVLRDQDNNEIWRTPTKPESPEEGKKEEA